MNERALQCAVRSEVVKWGAAVRVLDGTVGAFLDQILDLIEQEV